MASVQYSFKKTKAGVKCTGKVRMSCGHTITETFTARTEASAKDAVSRFIKLRAEGHGRTCTDM